MNVDAINLLLNKGVNVVFVAFVVFILHLIRNIENYLNVYDNIKSRKINKLQQAIEYSDMPKLELNRLKKLKADELYRQATGLKVSENIRSDVVKLINELSINEKQINTIRFYLAKDQNDLKIDIKKWEWSFLYLSNAITIFFAIFISLLVLVGVILLNAFGFQQEIAEPILTIFIMSIVVFFIYFNEKIKYNIIQKLYKSHHHLFKETEPNWAWKLGGIGIFVVFVAITVWVEKLLATM